MEHVSQWWTNLQATCIRYGRDNIWTWHSMKRNIKAYFIPPKYFRMNCRKFDKCQQGMNYIRFYESQLRNYHSHVNLPKNDEDTILRFIKRLHANIKE